MTDQGDLTSQHHEPPPLTSRRGLKKGWEKMNITNMWRSVGRNNKMGQINRVWEVREGSIVNNGVT